MARQPMVVQFGMGTDLRGSDYTKAAIRAVKDALRHNSLTVADAFDVPRDEMEIEVHLGAGKPLQVDKQAIIEVFPYGRVKVDVVQGGMDLQKDDENDRTILVNAGIVVFLDLPASEQTS